MAQPVKVVRHLRSQRLSIIPGITSHTDISDCVTNSSIFSQGRNASEQVKMLQQVEKYNQTCPPSERVTTSVEVEKTRPELYQLFCYGDVVRGQGWRGDIGWCRREAQLVKKESTVMEEQPALQLRSSHREDLRDFASSSSWRRKLPKMYWHPLYNY